MLNRNRLVKATLMLSASLGAVLTASGAWAAPQQDAQASPAATPSPPAADSATDGPVGDIIVTAQKRSQSINSVGVTITALSGDTLARRGITSTADLAKVVPGLTFTPSPYNAPIYTLRGVGYSESSLAASPAVSVYVDEVPLAFPSMTEGAQLDLERVEVLKGPQGTLYGQNSTGGAINFIAAKPTPVLKAGADLSFSRFATADASGFISGPITDTLRFRVSARSTQGGGWQQSSTRDDTNGRVNQVMGRLLLQWTPSSRLTVMANLNGWHDGSETLAGQLIAITPQNPANFPGGIGLSPLTSRAADWTPGWPHRDDSFFEASVRADYRLTDSVKLTSISAYQHFHEDRRSDLDATPLQANDYQQLGKIDAFNQELRLSGDTARLTWILGANYEHATIPETLIGNVKDLSTTKPIPFLPGFAQVPTRTSTLINSYAAFGNAEYKLTDHLTLIGGLRYTQTNRHFVGCTYASNQQIIDIVDTIQAGLVAAGAKTTPIVPVQLGQCSTLDANFNPTVNDNRLNQHNLSFRAGVNYKTDGGALLYASVSRGYKSGGSSVIASSSTAQLNPVTQERVMAYEAGVKIPMFDRKIQLNAATFYYDYKDKQLRGRVLDPIFFVLEELVNIPESRVVGAEAEIQAHPIHGLDLTIAGTFSDTKVRKFSGYNDDGLFLNYSGSAFPYTPKYQLVSDVQYSFDLGPRTAMFVGGGVHYNSSSVATFQSPSFPQPSDPLYRIDGYALLDLRAGIEAPDGAWRAMLWAKNVTNKYYWTNVFNANDEKYRLPGRPAEYGITLSVRWGK